jgi:hypothetical protein
LFVDATERPRVQRVQLTTVLLPSSTGFMALGPPLLSSTPMCSSKRVDTMNRVGNDPLRSCDRIK